MVRNCTVPGERLTQAQLVVSAIRCRRRAMDAEQPVLPSLFALLAERGCETLTPAFESLLRLAEDALGRPMKVGGRETCSADEALLLDLLAARTRLAPRLERPGPISALACAISSTRVMMRMAMA